jgi:subtilisin family serine protease
VTNVAWLLCRTRLRALLPMLAALAMATASALPAHAQARQAGAEPAGAESARAESAGAESAAARAGEWWLTALNVPRAWRAAPAKGKGVIIAVLSTGVDGSHPDLTRTVTAGPDLSQTGRGPGDAYWGAEGTAVASLIAGHGHGAGGVEGITGVAPGARILSIQVTLEYDDPLNSDAAITQRLPAAIAKGIRYAVGHGARVIALPLDPGTLGAAMSGDPAAAGGSQAERTAVRYAVAHGVLLIAPAGDNGAGTRTVNYPAAYPGVIAVGATARDGQLSPFTNVGSYVALTAPGSGDTPFTPGADVTTTDPAAGLLAAAPSGGYQSLASTDMSSALTAGVAALIRGRYPRLTVAEVTRALKNGATVPRADRSGTGKASAATPGWGDGELNAATALAAARTIAAAHPAPKPTPKPTPTPKPKAPKATAPARASSARPVASSRPDPGARVRSILLDLVAGACVLIAALACALAIARLRRRKRSGGAARSPRAEPPGPARHARTPPPPAPQAFLALSPPPAAARSQMPPWEIPRPAGPRAPAAARPLAPWERAPAEPRRRGADTPLAPWERAPDEFAAGPYPFPADEPPWPASSSGPMYIWNPPDWPAPERPASEWPAPEWPAPEWPATERPAPEWPALEWPAPDRPAPEWPDPEWPDPEWPAPERPAPDWLA